MKAKIDQETYAGLSDELKAEYAAQNDGTYLLVVETVGGFELADTKGLRNALSQERTKVQNMTVKLASFEGIEDPEAAKAAIAKVAEMQNWQPEDKARELIEQQKLALTKQFDKDKQTLITENKTLQTALEEQLVTNAALAAIETAKGSVKLLLPHIKARTRMRRTDQGQYIAEVIDPNGNVEIGDSSGNPKTIPQLVEELRQDNEYAMAFQPSGQQGTGGSGGSGGSGGRNASTPTRGTPPRTIDRNDTAAFSQNLEDIAAGKVTLAPQQ